MIRFLLICLGGAIGTGARYLVSVWAAAVFGASFPFGTVLVNAVGSFLAALLMQLGLSEWISPTPRLVLVTGVMGGFTTYSAFNYETLALIEGGSLRIGVLYVAITITVCIAAGMAGLALARVITGR